MIVFGYQLEDEYVKALKDIPKFFINTDELAKSFPNDSFATTGSVIFVDSDYMVGLNIRCQQECQVFAWYTAIPDAEEMLQTLGRGARDQSTMLGNVYVVANTWTEQTIQDGLSNSDGFDW